MKKISKIFLIFFLFIYKKNIYSSFEESVKLVPKDEISIVLDILSLGYKRSISTVNFWKNLNIFLEEYKKSTTQIISRMRNPSINFEEENFLISIDLNKIFIETKIAYDKYSEKLNYYYNNNLLSEESKNYINLARNIPESPLIIFSHSIKYFYNIFKDKFDPNKFFNLKNFSTTRNSFAYKIYIKLDKTLTKIHEENCNFQINLYKNYENFWILEKERAKNFYEAIRILEKFLE